VIRVAEKHAIVASPSSSSLQAMDVHDESVGARPFALNAQCYQTQALPRQASPIAAHKMRKQADARRTLDHKPGVYSDYKPLLHADKGFIKSVQKGAVQVCDTMVLLHTVCLCSGATVSRTICVDSASVCRDHAVIRDSTRAVYGKSDAVATSD
jgi:hypothetical protein